MTGVDLRHKLSEYETVLGSAVNNLDELEERLTKKLKAASESDELNHLEIAADLYNVKRARKSVEEVRKNL